MATPKITPDDVYGPDPIEVAMDAGGLTVSNLIERLKAKLEARENKIFHYQGDIAISPSFEALDIQLKALDMALRLRKAYPDPKLDLNLTQPIKVEIIDRFEVEK